jgi:hypothetical protein
MGHDGRRMFIGGRRSQDIQNSWLYTHDYKEITMAHWYPKKHIKNCPFCWEKGRSVLRPEDRVLFHYGSKEYEAHKECLEVWELCRDAIHRGVLTSQGKYEDDDMKVACKFVEKFFKIIRNMEKKALAGYNTDYHKYHD